MAGKDNDYRMDMHRLQQMMHSMSCTQREHRPASLRDYALENPLGKGAYGRVYRVHNVRDGRDYALKQITVSASHEGIPQCVLREISVMKQVAKKAHPNIVALKQVFHQLMFDRNTLTINMIMEKCDWDLHTFIQKIPTKIPEQQARHITSQIVQGLDFLHTHSIVHRDLKPQNILVNRDQTVKLADFGLAKVCSNTTAFTVCVVTLWYRAPEVLLQTSYSCTVDMWSLGCIVSELYSREPLFQGFDESDQLKRIFSMLGTPVGEDWPRESAVSKSSFVLEHPKKWMDINPYMSNEALDFVRQCLVYDPIRRLPARIAMSHEFMKPPPMHEFEPFDYSKYL